MKFQREYAPRIFPDLEPLIQKNFKEIARFQDIPLLPDWSVYYALEKAGCARFFTARDDDNILVGYCVFLVKEHPHFKGSIQANQDFMFIDKEKRGFGYQFIKWCDEELRKEKVQVVYQHVNSKHNFGKLLERLDYDLVDLVYAKRLD